MVMRKKPPTQHDVNEHRLHQHSDREPPVHAPRSQAVSASDSARPTQTWSAEVAVLSTGLFVPGYGGVTSFLEGRHSEEHIEPKAAFIPARHRRRSSRFTKALAEAYTEALTQAAEGWGDAVHPASVASVFGSALGEASTMIGLLEQMWTDEGALSPMRFVTSVHNTAAGLMSIAGQNRGFTTSIGADFDTPAMGLTEGIGLVLAKEQYVLVCCGDEAVPEHLVQHGEG